MTSPENLNQYSDPVRIQDSEIELTYNIHSVAKYIRDIELKDYFNPKGFQNDLGIDLFLENEQPIYKRLVKQKNSKVRKVQAIGLAALLLGSTFALKDNLQDMLKIEINEQFIEQITKRSSDYQE